MNPIKARFSIRRGSAMLLQYPILAPFAEDSNPASFDLGTAATGPTPITVQHGLAGGTLALCDGFCNKLFCSGNGFDQRQSTRQIGSNGRRIGAACSVRADAPQEWRPQQKLLTASIKNIHGLTESPQMPSLNQGG